MSAIDSVEFLKIVIRKYLVRLKSCCRPSGNSLSVLHCSTLSSSISFSVTASIANGEKKLKNKQHNNTLER